MLTPKSCSFLLLNSWIFPGFDALLLTFSWHFVNTFVASLFFSASSACSLWVGGPSIVCCSRERRSNLMLWVKRFKGQDKKNILVRAFKIFNFLYFCTNLVFRAEHEMQQKYFKRKVQDSVYFVSYFWSFVKSHCLSYLVNLIQFLNLVLIE